VKPRRSPNTTTTSTRWPSSTPSSPRPIDQFGHLRGEEAPQPVDPLRTFLRYRQLARHLVEPGCEPPEFISGRDRDPMVEVACADALGTVLQEADRPGHASGQPIGERAREQRAG